MEEKDKQHVRAVADALTTPTLADVLRMCASTSNREKVIALSGELDKILEGHTIGEGIIALHLTLCNGIMGQMDRQKKKKESPATA